MNKFLVAAMAATAAFCGPAFAAESIVGTWDNEDCARPMVIGQLSLQANDTICRFDTVKRNGDRVTWKGDCDGEPRTVIAELSGDELFVEIKGVTVFTGLKRCNGGGASKNKCKNGTVAITWPGGQKACVKRSVYNQAKRNCAKNDAPPEDCLCEDGGVVGACGD
jgi:hypothetical protein